MRRIRRTDDPPRWHRASREGSRDGGVSYRRRRHGPGSAASCPARRPSSPWPPSCGSSSTRGTSTTTRATRCCGRATPSHGLHAGVRGAVRPHAAPARDRAPARWRCRSATTARSTSWAGSRCCASAALVWLTYRARRRAVLHRGRGDRRARRAHAAGAAARRAARLPGPGVRAALVVGAVLLEVAAPPARRCPVLALLAVAGPAAARRRGCWPALYALYCGCASRPYLAVARRSRRAVLGAERPDRHRRRAALPARDVATLAEAAGRRRDIEDVPYWTPQYFGSTLREPLLVGDPGRARVRLAAPARRLAPLAHPGRGRRRDDARVRGRPDLRAAADRPLRAHAGRPAVASSSGCRVRLAAAGAARHRARWALASRRRCAGSCSSSSCPRNVRMLDAAGDAHRPRRAASTRTCARSRARRASCAPPCDACGADRRPPTTGPIPYLR